jgi:hypothetical protein
VPALSRKIFADGAALAALGLGSSALLACSTLIGLDGLERDDCVSDCAAAPTGGVDVGGSSPVGSAGKSGLGGNAMLPSAGTSSGGTTSLGGATTQGGSDTGAGTGATSSDGGTAGAGATGPTGICPAGAMPPAGWKEHWTGHSQALTLRDFDDCVAIYVDADMAAVDTAWLSSFLSKAWTYNLNTYGALGSERLFVILHQNKNLGGQVSAFYDATRDGRNSLDLGASSWKPGDYELAGTQLSALVERTAVPGKQGAPASAAWGAAGFAEIYKYDLFLGLGMNDEASAAADGYTPLAQTYPVPNSYWFSDFFYPCWQDHGKTGLLVKFFGLLKQYYPVNNQVMPPMNFGQYVHFMSGAAGAEIKTQATYAFGWDDNWEAQLQQARSDFPAIKY